MGVPIDSFEVAIVGSGPAGISAALHLLKRAPALAAHSVVLEKAHHPRPKLCGGGLSPISQYVLDELDLDLVLTYVPINRVSFRFNRQRATVRQPQVIKVIRRDEFDAAMVAEARRRGVQVWEGVEFNGLEVDGDGLRLNTSQGAIRARAVVGADGANSRVRRGLELSGPSRISRVLEVLTPEDPTTQVQFREHEVMFDFTPATRGLQGYAWDFPSSIAGRAYMNRGLFDSRVRPERPKPDMKSMFREALAERGRDVDDYELMGHPGRWFDPQAPISAPRVLLTGDAAGVEPLEGDGIGCSLWYGQVVASELVRAFRTGDFSFSGYRARVLAHPLGRYLMRRLRQARFVYGLRNPAAMSALWFYLNVRFAWQSARPFAARTSS